MRAMLRIPCMYEHFVSTAVTYIYLVHVSLTILHNLLVHEVKQEQIEVSIMLSIIYKNVYRGII